MPGGADAGKANVVPGGPITPASTNVEEGDTPTTVPESTPSAEDEIATLPTPTPEPEAPTPTKKERKQSRSSRRNRGIRARKEAKKNDISADLQNVAAACGLDGIEASNSRRCGDYYDDCNRDYDCDDIYYGINDCDCDDRRSNNRGYSTDYDDNKCYGCQRQSTGRAVDNCLPTDKTI